MTGLSSDVSSAPKSPPPESAPCAPKRVVVRARGPEAGPAFIAIGSLHGNEPSGLAALQEVAKVIDKVNREQGQVLLRGDFLGLAGNLVALERRRRFIDYDLNRGWSQDRLRHVSRDGASNVEEQQMLELFELIQELRNEARGALRFLDLHSTSGESPPFASIAAAKPDRELVSAIPVPTVLGIDRHLNGTFLECMHSFGFSGIGFEGGQHDEKAAVDHNEAALWLVLEKLGMVDRSIAPVIAGRLTWAHDLLQPIGMRYPKLLRIVYRHGLEASADFTMCPGFESFQPVQQGELLATHCGKPVHADRNGRILMPLYQRQGDEGFFLIEET